MSNQSQWEDVKPPFAILYFLLTLAWIIVSIFKILDPTGHITLGTMSAVAILSTYYLYIGRTSQNHIKQGSVFFFILSWLGVNTFSHRQLIIFQVSLEQWRYFIILPIAIIWFIPYNEDRFFGLQEVSQHKYLEALWKLSIIVILIINSFQLPTVSELLVLLPLIIEPVYIYKHNKDQLPILTLHIQHELQDKFAVPISMLKGIILIMGSFIFELINSRLWLLVILIYFGAGFVWFLDFIIPEEIRSGTSDDKFETVFKEFTASDEKPVDTRTNSTATTESRRYESQRSNEQSEVISGTAEIKVETLENKLSQMDYSPLQEVTEETTEATPMGQKAHALGTQVRTELQKPQYNLNHILSTLSEEDFTSAYRVPYDDLEFNSTKGKWCPPQDLILFPIQLAKYDYRRVDEILLLGFNRPIKSGQSSIDINFGKNSKYNTKISDDQIQIGDTTFNMKTLILELDQWNDAKKQLEIIEDVEDISYTGFETLKELQQILGKISKKWLELRKQAEDAVVNFLAGLLGSTDPIFLGRNEIEDKIEGSVLNKDNYIVEDSN